MIHTEFWQKKWQDLRTPWDLGHHHDSLDTLLTLANEGGTLARAARFYVPGCGRAHEARRLASMGYQVIAEDIVPEAIAAAAMLSNPLQLSLRVGNALVCPEDERESVDGICDRAMLCALDPTQRQAYQDACWNRLKPGGVFMGILFSKVIKENPPPHGIPLGVLLCDWSPRFSLLAALELGDSSSTQIQTQTIVHEYCVVLRKNTKS